MQGLLFLVLAAFSITFSTLPVAHAAGIVVNSLADTIAPSDGNCTLREAIINANSDTDTTSGDCAAGSGSDIITFSVSGTITLTASLPPITTEITIDGDGQTIALSGANTYRHFMVAREP